MRRYESHEHFFDDVGSSYIVVNIWGIESEFTVEEMYQHFKARLLDEMKDIQQSAAER